MGQKSIKVIKIILWRRAIDLWTEIDLWNEI